MTRVVTTLPQWFLGAAPDAKFNAKEVCLLFDFRGDSCIHASIRGGHFPPPDSSGLALTTRNRHRVYWHKVTLMTEIRRRHRG